MSKGIAVLRGWLLAWGAANVITRGSHRENAIKCAGTRHAGPPKWGVYYQVLPFPAPTLSRILLLLEINTKRNETNHISRFAPLLYPLFLSLPSLPFPQSSRPREPRLPRRLEGTESPPSSTVTAFADAAAAEDFRGPSKAGHRIRGGRMDLRG